MGILGAGDVPGVESGCRVGRAPEATVAEGRDAGVGTLTKLLQSECWRLPSRHPCIMMLHERTASPAVQEALRMLQRSKWMSTYSSQRLIALYGHGSRIGKCRFLQRTFRALSDRAAP